MLHLIDLPKHILAEPDQHYAVTGQRHRYLFSAQAHLEFSYRLRNQSGIFLRADAPLKGRLADAEPCRYLRVRASGTSPLGEFFAVDGDSWTACHYAVTIKRSAEMAANVRPSPSSVASRPVKFCQRWTITSQYIGSISKP